MTLLISVQLWISVGVAIIICIGLLCLAVYALLRAKLNADNLDQTDTKLIGFFDNDSREDLIQDKVNDQALDIEKKLSQPDSFPKSIEETIKQKNILAEQLAQQFAKNRLKFSKSGTDKIYQVTTTPSDSDKNFEPQHLVTTELLTNAPLSVKELLDKTSELSEEDIEKAVTVFELEKNYEKEFSTSPEIRIILVAIPIAIIIIIFLSLTFIPIFRNRLPIKIAAQLKKIPILFGMEFPPPTPLPSPQVEVKESEISYKEAKGSSIRIAQVRGTIKNLSSKPLMNLRIEMQLFRRESSPIILPEVRVIPLDTQILLPNQIGHYSFEISDKAYSSTKLGRVLSNEGKEILKK